MEGTESSAMKLKADARNWLYFEKASLSLTPKLAFFEALGQDGRTVLEVEKACLEVEKACGFDHPRLTAVTYPGRADPALRRS
jgi:hypothetical protein